MIILCHTSLSSQLAHLPSGNTESKVDSKSLFLNFKLLNLLLNCISKFAFSFRKWKQIWCKSEFLVQTHHHLSKWDETNLTLICHLSFAGLFLGLKCWGNFLYGKWILMEHSPSLYLCRPSDGFPAPCSENFLFKNLWAKLLLLIHIDEKQNGV